MRKLILLAISLSASLAIAGTLRNQQADTLVSTDTTKSWTLPSASDTICGLTSTQTLTNKTINSANNTLTGVLSNPMTTGGDIIYGGTSGTATRLANGSSGQVLTSAGGTSAPSWQTPSGGASTATRGLYNFGISAGSGSPANSISFTVTQADGATAPTSGSPAIFSTVTNYPYGASSLSITSTLSITIPAGGTLGIIPGNGINYYIWIYLINNGSSADICVTGVNPYVGNGVTNATDVFQTSLVVTGQISSSSNVAGAVYCATKSSGAAPAQLVGRAYAQAGILNTSNQWTTSVNAVTVAPNITRFYTNGAYQASGTILPTATNAHVFTIPSSSITAGAIYSTGGNYFMASNTIASTTSVTMASLSGFVTPSGTGTLTLVSGTGPATIAYTAVTNSRPVLSTAATVNYVSYVRDGDMIDAWFNYYSTATLTSAAAGTGDYLFNLPFPMNASAYSGSGGGALLNITAQTVGTFNGATANNQYKIQAWGTAEQSSTLSFYVNSAVPYYMGGVLGGAAIAPLVRVLGMYGTNAAITNFEVPMGSSIIPLGSNVAMNFHVRYASTLGIYGP